MVRPLREASTSPGRMASPEIEFSATGISTTSRTFSPAAMTMRPSARAWAAPPMSFFIKPMDPPGLMFRPPVSNTTPLPTMAIRGAEASSPQLSSKMRGWRCGPAARPTA